MPHMSTLYNNLQVGNPLHLNIQHQIYNSCMHLANAYRWENYKDITKNNLEYTLKKKIILQTKLKKTNKKKCNIHKPKFFNARNHILNGGNTSRRF